MHASECRTYPTEEIGCAAHGKPECLCDVQPLETGVPIRLVPNASRLLADGLDRQAFLAWAEELRVGWDGSAYRLVAEV